MKCMCRLPLSVKLMAINCSIESRRCHTRSIGSENLHFHTGAIGVASPPRQWTMAVDKSASTKSSTTNETRNRRLLRRPGASLSTPSDLWAISASPSNNLCTGLVAVLLRPTSQPEYPQQKRGFGYIMLRTFKRLAFYDATPFSSHFSVFICAAYRSEANAFCRLIRCDEKRNDRSTEA